MEIWTAIVKDGVITLQSAPYIEHGPYIEITADEIDQYITLYEIPYGGGEPVLIDTFSTVIDAIEHSKKLT
jgi:hypothetical protein